MKTKNKMETEFAPAERATEETIKNQVESILNASYLQKLYSAVSDIVLILNKERQIVFFNPNLLDMVGKETAESICGLRVGEVLHCSHAFETKGGCGTTAFCKECGAVNAILSSQNGKPDQQECRITRKDSGDALDLKIRTSQITLDNEEYTIVSVSDISHEKRRRILERIFFHDIMNTAVGVRGLSELLTIAEEEQLDEFRNMIYSGSEKLVDEIKMQKDLVAAENNELQFTPVSIESIKFLKEIVDIYKRHEVAKYHTLVIDSTSVNVTFESDKTLLFRVIANMTKNALEASAQGGTVTIGCAQENNKIKFYVHNPSYMSQSVQLQVFQRSFSTKGAGRGLGTYSMKLLSERYLKGSVFFRSSKENGTTFFGIYPLVMDSSS
ncbi:MAG: PAS domain-containing sensor histidine kinase [Desulfamplus sp.]|nr:PAS domain-containing sensor histidine kinase [Desulfamplus sp.]